MSSLRRAFAITPTRPTGPRCRGGASSLLRIGQRSHAAAALARAGGGRETGFGDAAIEHFVGQPSAWQADR